MKMKIGAELPEGYTPSHEDLASTSGTLIAQSLLHLFTDNMSEELARANVTAIVTELAYLLDEGEVEMGGKTYRPRLAFVDDTGAALPGFEHMETLADLVTDPFDIDPEAKLTFEEPEFDEE